ncbi:MAG: type I-B CRISPR-associated endonuclease Cas1b [Thermoflavifilum sp.]|nr:type I-B CRISPR-associated endonuclease Cas1b [Thermoflavifilum sp.]
MKKNFYIFKNGRLKRKDNTIIFEFSADEAEQRRVMPIEAIDDIYLFGEIDLNTRVLNFMAQNGVIGHVFNYYDNYAGSFYPRETNVSGSLVIAQVIHYMDYEKRLIIAKEILKGAFHGILKNLHYYQNRSREISNQIEIIENLSNDVQDANTIAELLGIEGKIHEVYYNAWNTIFTTNDDVFQFTLREKKPPSNPINALISFGNSLVYSIIISELYHTQLNPTIGYLHEPGTRRFTLSLDLAEIFKPLLSDRLIFTLINHKRIQKEHFDDKLNYAYLNEKGRRIFVEAFDEKLQTTVRHPQLKRNVSYRQLIRLECYKLSKHVLGIKEYNSFRMWW